MTRKHKPAKIMCLVITPIAQKHPTPSIISMFAVWFLSSLGPVSIFHAITHRSIPKNIKAVTIDYSYFLLDLFVDEHYIIN